MAKCFLLSIWTWSYKKIRNSTSQSFTNKSQRSPASRSQTCDLSQLTLVQILTWCLAENPRNRSSLKTYQDSETIPNHLWADDQREGGWAPFFAKVSLWVECNWNGESNLSMFNCNHQLIRWLSTGDGANTDIGRPKKTILLLWKRKLLRFLMHVLLKSLEGLSIAWGHGDL